MFKLYDTYFNLFNKATDFAAKVVGTGVYGVTATNIRLSNMLFGADALKVKDEDGRAVIHKFVANGDLYIEAVEALVDAGIDVKMLDEAKRSLLFYAASSKVPSRKTIELLVTKYNLNVNHKDQDGQTALHVAASKGRMDNLEALLRMNANINEQDKNGRTALHYAAQNIFSSSCVGVLLAVPQIKKFYRDHEGNMAIDIAAEMNGELNFTKIYNSLSSSEQINLLCDSLRRGKINSILLLINNNIDIFGVDNFGKRPMEIVIDKWNELKEVYEEEKTKKYLIQTLKILSRKCNANMLEKELDRYKDRVGLDVIVSVLEYNKHQNLGHKIFEVTNCDNPKEKDYLEMAQAKTNLKDAL